MIAIPTRRPLWTPWGEGPPKLVNPFAWFAEHLRRSGSNLIKSTQASTHLSKNCGICCNDFGQAVVNCPACPDGPVEERFVPSALEVQIAGLFESVCTSFDGSSRRSNYTVASADGTYNLAWNSDSVNHASYSGFRATQVTVDVYQAEPTSCVSGLIESQEWDLFLSLTLPCNSTVSNGLITLSALLPDGETAYHNSTVQLDLFSASITPDLLVFGIECASSYPLDAIDNTTTFSFLTVAGSRTHAEGGTATIDV